MQTSLRASVVQVAESRRLYDATQSRIHVIVTKAFLRSLARLDLAESRVGRFHVRPLGGT